MALIFLSQKQRRPVLAIGCLMSVALDTCLGQIVRLERAPDQGDGVRVKACYRAWNPSPVVVDAFAPHEMSVRIGLPMISHVPTLRLPICITGCISKIRGLQGQAHPPTRQNGEK
jgi:hypothetical protein